MALTFLTSLAGGTLATLAACPLASVSSKFLRLATLIILGLIVLPLAWIIARHSLPDATELRTWIVLGAAAVITAAGLGLISDHPRRARTNRILSAIGAATTLYGSFLIAQGLGIWPLRGATVHALSTLNFLLAAAMLGTVTLSWLLGHAYLTASDMSLAPLRRLGNLFAGVVALRCLFAVLSLLVLWLAAPSGDASPQNLTGFLAALGLKGMDPLFLALRVGVGILPMPFFAWMTRDCIKARNTQSTTGVLYFTSVFVYVGELSSLHVMATMGLPL